MKATTASTNRADRRRRERAGSARPSRSRWVAAGVTAVILAGLAAIAIINRDAVPKGATAMVNPVTLHVGQLAPSFKVTTVDGRVIDSGKVAGPIMLEVFASWCPHCQHETKVLDDLYLHTDGKLTMVSVTGSDLAADHKTEESVDDVKAFAQYFGVAYNVAFDPDLTVANHYFQGGFPTIVFIKPDKHIAAIEQGEVPLQRLLADAQKAGA
jgi:thiol-disulfide isomerase/thioredoxin